MKAIIAWWKGSPAVRFAARTIAVAVGGYVVQTIRSGNPWTWGALISGAGTAAFTAICGLIGLEPFVGINKPTNVSVPVPPAIKETP